jgi:hypothetical protein
VASWRSSPDGARGKPRLASGRHMVKKDANPKLVYDAAGINKAELAVSAEKVNLIVCTA